MASATDRCRGGSTLTVQTDAETRQIVIGQNNIMQVVNTQCDARGTPGSNCIFWNCGEGSQRDETRLTNYEGGILPNDAYCVNVTWTGPTSDPFGGEIDFTQLTNPGDLSQCLMPNGSDQCTFNEQCQSGNCVKDTNTHTCRPKGWSPP